jgi:hypothetical protein
MGATKFQPAPTLYSLYANNAPQTADVYVGIFVDDTCIYVTVLQRGFFFRKFQRGLSDLERWYEQWNIEINEDKTQAIYFSQRLCTLKHIFH